MIGRHDGIPVTEAATPLDLSQEAVRKRINHGTPKGYKQDGEWYVVLAPGDLPSGRQDGRATGRSRIPSGQTTARSGVSRHARRVRAGAGPLQRAAHGQGLRWPAPGAGCGARGQSAADRHACRDDRRTAPTGGGGGGRTRPACGGAGYAGGPRSAGREAPSPPRIVRGLPGVCATGVRRGSRPGSSPTCRFGSAVAYCRASSLLCPARHGTRRVGASPDRAAAAVGPGTLRLVRARVDGRATVPAGDARPRLVPRRASLGARALPPHA
jgi:hypothetical protein